MATVRVPPPKRGGNKPRSAQGRGKTAPQEIQSWIFRYRDQLWPFWAMLVIFLIALIVKDPLWLAGGYLAAAALVYWQGDRVRLDRQEERMYASAVLAGAGGWSAWAMLSDGPRPWLALPLITCLVAIPWWRHRTVKKTIPITFGADLDRVAKADAQRRANNMIANWDVISRQGKIQFSELRGITFSLATMDVEVLLRGGQSVRSLAYPSVRSALESSFDAPTDSLRPRSIRGRSRLAVLQFVLRDLNEDTLGTPPEDVVNMGRFETGEPVEFDDGVHTLVAGANGGGKSALINQVIRRKARNPVWALVGVDLKPGGLELGPWGNVMAYLADNPDKARIALEGLVAGLTFRGEIMRQRGWREWRATAAEPNVCLIVDEAQQLVKHRLMGPLLELANLGRAYGFQLVLATQYPKDSNLPSGIMSQVRQIFCFRLRSPTEDRVVFGENATADGYSPSTIPLDRAGTFYVRSSLHGLAQRARAWFLTVSDVQEEAAALAATAIDQATGRGFLAEGLSASQTAVEPRRYEEPEGDVVEAVLVPEGLEDLPEAAHAILAAIGKGAGTTAKIVDATGVSRAQVNRILRELDSRGLIAHEGTRASDARPWFIV